MGISKKKKKLLCEYEGYKCENCKKKFKFAELEIHRICAGDEGGGYQYRNCKVVCKKCHEILSSAQRIARGISK